MHKINDAGGINMWILFHEKLTRKSAVGVVLITVGTALMTMV